MAEKESIFTTLPDIQRRKIAENNTAWAFLTNIPITPGHALLSPKRVVEKVDELTTEELADIFALISLVKDALCKTFNAKGFNLPGMKEKDTDNLFNISISISCLVLQAMKESPNTSQENFSTDQVVGRIPLKLSWLLSQLKFEIISKYVIKFTGAVLRYNQ